jgi:NADH:ubiquinone oxidoreductase subunit B-like Fe-S oxidoreductase
MVMGNLLKKWPILRQDTNKCRTTLGNCSWCISSGGILIPYSVLQGIDKGIPVEFMYRCPPRPEQIVRV